jgi:hypothetical protein
VSRRARGRRAQKAFRERQALYVKDLERRVAEGSQNAAEGSQNANEGLPNAVEGSQNAAEGSHSVQGVGGPPDVDEGSQDVDEGTREVDERLRRMQEELQGLRQDLIEAPRAQKASQEHQALYIQQLERTIAQGSQEAAERLRCAHEEVQSLREALEAANSRILSLTAALSLASTKTDPVIDPRLRDEGESAPSRVRIDHPPSTYYAHQSHASHHQPPQEPVYHPSNMDQGTYPSAGSPYGTQPSPSSAPRRGVAEGQMPTHDSRSEAAFIRRRRPGTRNFSRGQGLGLFSTDLSDD